MKKIIPLFVLISIFGCKDESQEINLEDETTIPSQENVDSLRVFTHDFELQQKTFNIKRQELKEKKDSKEELENLIITKSFFKQGDWYSLDFKYPYLNEKIKPSYENFNEYIGKYYLDAEGVEKQILEEKRLCDSLGCPPQDEKRLVDYKIHNLNDRLISILFYKENHYTGAAHAAYTFESMNFDLERSVFMNYEDFFNNGSEKEMQEILNELLRDKINSGEMFYDCWEISFDDFFEFKNNFVIDNNFVEFYFDDCIICPSYTGTYSIKIPLEKLLPVLKKYKINPLLG